MTSSLIRVGAGSIAVRRLLTTQHFRVASEVWRSLMWLVTLWLAAGAAHAVTAPTLVTLVAGANHALLPGSDRIFEVRIPITVLGSTPIAVRKVDVVYKDERSSGLFKAFAVTSDFSDVSNGAALVVRAANALLPGTYVISLAMSSKDEVQEQPVLLNLTVPAPQVKSNAKVIVSQLLYPGGSSVSGGTLEVRVVSGKVGALDITPMAMNDAPVKGAPVTAALTFVPVTGTDAYLMSPAKFMVMADGEFPLGKTTGSIDLISPHLGTPLSVPFEVRTHRSEILILLVAAAGTFFGWLLRVFLTQRQTLLDARGAIAVATRTALRAKRTCTDHSFATQVGVLVEQLEDAADTDDPKRMSAAAKAVEDAVKKLREDIEAKVPNLTTQLQNLNKIADVEWALPPPLGEAVAALREPIRKATDLLNWRDVTGAEKHVDRLVNHSIPTLARDLVAFGEHVSKYLAFAAHSPFPASELETRRLVELAAAANTAAANIKATVMMGTLEETTVAMSKTHELFLEIQAVADMAAPMTERLCSQVSTKLQRAFGNIDATFNPVRAESVGAAQRFAAGISSPRTGILGLDTGAVIQCWADWLVGLSPKVAPEKLKEFLLNAKWVAAVDLAISAGPRPIGAPLDEALPSVEGHNMPIAGGDGGEVQMAAGARNLGNEVIVDPAKEIFAQSEANRAFIVQSRTTAALQSLCFGSIFVIGAYVIYGEDWVGTAKEMLAVFILAFGMDLTSDGVLGSLKKAPK